MPTPTMSEAELAVFLKQAGFELKPGEIKDYLEAYQHIRAMAALLRNKPSYMVEPAHVFVAGEGSAK